MSHYFKSVAYALGLPQPPEIDREKIDSRYRLVIMASQRAKALALGAKSELGSTAIKFTTKGEVLVEVALPVAVRVVTPKGEE